ncbi:MAG: calcium-binding protein, partial [Sulfurisoma sp.]|nr:calcium-binding protein [Sulfurisoma sp.]
MFTAHRAEMLSADAAHAIQITNNSYIGSAVPRLDVALDSAYQVLFPDLATRHAAELTGFTAASFSPVDLLIDTGAPDQLPAANLLDATEYNADGSERKARNLIVGDKGFNIILKGGAGDDVIVAGAGNDYLYGGDDNDQLYGGTGTDQLYGGDGNDTLDGRDNAGGDILDGGAGTDTYYGDEGDTIRDSDGKGIVYFNGKRLTFATRKTGETDYTDTSSGLKFTLTGTTLQVGDPLTIEGFDNGELGIYLDEEEDPEDPAKLPAYNPNSAVRFFASSPLALDLNGNGLIDDIALTNSPVYFDLTNDGIAEKTGWLAATDGLLGLDMNGNGIIDNRNELFGTDPQHTAFDRMRELVDANQDGTINADDPLFGALRVWQDSNQDGISQAGELHTLAQLGITAIDATAVAVSQTTAHGNRIIATAGFTRDGVRQTVVDIEFAYDPAQTNANPNRPLGLPPTLDSEVFDLPWLRGYGVVKSLPIAYQQSPALRQAASDLVNSGWQSILTHFDSFMAKWTGLDAAHQARGVTRTNLTAEDKVWMLESLIGQDVRKSAIEAANFGTASFAARQGWDLTYIDSQWQSFVQREAVSFAVQIATHDWLKGASYSLNQDRFITTDGARVAASLLDRFNTITQSTEAAFTANVVMRLRGDGMALDAAALRQGLTDSAFKTLFQTVLDQASTATIETVAVGSSGDDVLEGGTGDDILEGGVGNDALYGGQGNDIYIFGKGYGQDVVSDYGSTAGGSDTLRMADGVAPGEVTVTRDQYHLYLSLNNGADRLTLQNWFYGDDYKIERVEFADHTVWTAADLANRVVVAPATQSDDALFGSEGDNVIEGLGGNDYIAAGGGNDTLDGGAGNDTLDGGAGNDTYLFGRGDGQDTISSYDGNQNKQDAIRFKEGVAPTDVVVSRQGDHLMLKITGTPDQLTVQNYFSNEGAFMAYGVEAIRFADNTSWDYAAIKAKSLEATAGNDWLIGGGGDDALGGLGGDDHIEGRAGVDVLTGGTGNDTLNGQDGNDTLDGGAGNDSLQGGTGNDIYVFGNGYGQDVINDYEWPTGNIDTVQMAEGVAPADVTVTRDAYHLYLSLNGGADRLTLQNWFYGDAYKIERVSFGGGTVWTAAELANRVVVAPATANDDALFGSEGDNVIEGLGGNDYIAAGGGNDALDGGAGNDSLDGGVGNDVYRFGVGDGQDTITSYEATQTKQDVIQFKAGVTPADVVVSRQGDNLILKINGTPDQLAVQNYFSYEGSFNPYGVEAIRFDDNTSWDHAA